jgi:amidase
LIDAVIMPVAPHAAVIPGKFFHTGQSLVCQRLKRTLMTIKAYTESINLMDYSTVVIPVTKADKNLDIPDNGFTPLNDVDAKNWEACEPRYNFSKYLKVAADSFR